MAQFLAAYGAPTLLGPGWPTDDGGISWRGFWILYGRLPAVQALERISLGIGTAAGIAQAFAKRRADAQQLVDLELDRAFPGWRPLGRPKRLIIGPDEVDDGD